VCWGCDPPDWDMGQCVSTAGPFVDLAAGPYHSCGLRDDGTVECWGCGDGPFDAGQCSPP